MRGSYHVQLPDGRTQIVNYIADDKGYRTNITYVQTNSLYIPSTCSGCDAPSNHQQKEEEARSRHYLTSDYQNDNPNQFTVITGRSSSSPNGRFPPRELKQTADVTNRPSFDFTTENYKFASQIDSTKREPRVRQQEKPSHFPRPSENNRRTPDEVKRQISRPSFGSTPIHASHSKERDGALRTPRVMSRDRNQGKIGVPIARPRSREIQSERVELTRKSLERDEESRRSSNRDIIKSSRSHSSLYERLRPKLKPLFGNSEAQNALKYSIRNPRTDARPFGKNKMRRRTTNERRKPRNRIERKPTRGTPNHKRYLNNNQRSSLRAPAFEKNEEEVTTTTVRTRPTTRPRISRRKLDFYVSENKSEQNIDEELAEVLIIPVETTEELNPEAEIIFMDETPWEQELQLQPADLFTEVSLNLTVDNEKLLQESNLEKDVATEPITLISIEEKAIQVDNINTYISDEQRNSFDNSISHKSYVFTIIFIAIVNFIFNVIMC